MPMNDSALEWLLPQLPALKAHAYRETGLARRVTLLTNWLWMDERFDTRLDGLLAAQIEAEYGFDVVIHASRLIDEDRWTHA